MGIVVIVNRDGDRDEHDDREHRHDELSGGDNRKNKVAFSGITSQHRVVVGIICRSSIPQGVERGVAGGCVQHCGSQGVPGPCEEP